MVKNVWIVGLLMTTAALGMEKKTEDGAKKLGPAPVIDGVNKKQAFERIEKGFQEGLAKKVALSNEMAGEINITLTDINKILDEIEGDYSLLSQMEAMGNEIKGGSFKGKDGQTILQKVMTQVDKNSKLYALKISDLTAKYQEEQKVLKQAETSLKAIRDTTGRDLEAKKAAAKQKYKGIVSNPEALIGQFETVNKGKVALKDEVATAQKLSDQIDELLKKFKKIVPSNIYDSEEGKKVQENLKGSIIKEAIQEIKKSLGNIEEDINKIVADTAQEANESFENLSKEMKYQSDKK